MSESKYLGNFKTRSLRMAVETAMVFAGAMILPFLVHLAPDQNGLPIGAVWLPMFYAPLIAALLYKPEAGFVAGILVPLVNGLMTGRPSGSLMWTLSLEIGVFVLAVYMLSKYVKMGRLAWTAGFWGYLIAKLVATLLLAGLGDSSFSNLSTAIPAWPGVLMFLIIGYVTIKWRENRY